MQDRAGKVPGRAGDAHAPCGLLPGKQTLAEVDPWALAGRGAGPQEPSAPSHGATASPHGDPWRRTDWMEAVFGGAGGSAASGGGPGMELPDATRQHMEAAFGADLSDVRVHEDARATDLGAAAFAEGSDLHFASGRFAPTTEAGRALIGHELVHVLQQRAGRVRGAQGKHAGGSVNLDSALEAEADELGTAAARGMRVQVPGAPALGGGGAGPPVKQGYRIVSSGQVGASHPFDAQEKGKNGSFLDEEQAARIVGRDGSDHCDGSGGLRVSEGGQLAIEDADLRQRQPKHFFADASLISGWNDRLVRTGSKFQLYAVAGQTVTVPSPGGDRNLVRVEAVNAAAESEPGKQGTCRGLTMTAVQNCDAMARSVVGRGRLTARFLDEETQEWLSGLDSYTEDQCHYPLVSRLLDGVEEIGTADLDDNSKLEVVARAYGGALKARDEHRKSDEQEHGDDQSDSDERADDELTEKLRRIGINEYARPEMGQAMVSQKLGGTEVGGRPNLDYVTSQWIQGDDDHIFPYHWGGVVAEDGGDYITLENYSRLAEDHHEKQPNEDPRPYFQMYGTDSGQTWHDAWSRIDPEGQNIPNAMSMVCEGAGERDGYFDKRAGWYVPDPAAVQNDQDELRAAGNEDQEARALYKALAVVQARAALTVVDAWQRQLGARPMFEENAELHQHVTTRFGEVQRNPFRVAWNRMSSALGYLNPFSGCKESS